MIAAQYLTTILQPGVLVPTKPVLISAMLAKDDTDSEPHALLWNTTRGFSRSLGDTYNRLTGLLRLPNLDPWLQQRPLIVRLLKLFYKHDSDAPAWLGIIPSRIPFSRRFNSSDPLVAPGESIRRNILPLGGGVRLPLGFGLADLPLDGIQFEYAADATPNDQATASIAFEERGRWFEPTGLVFPSDGTIQFSRERVFYLADPNTPVGANVPEYKIPAIARHCYRDLLRTRTIMLAKVLSPSTPAEVVYLALTISPHDGRVCSIATGRRRLESFLHAFPEETTLLLTAHPDFRPAFQEYHHQGAEEAATGKAPTLVFPAYGGSTTTYRAQPYLTQNRLSGMVPVTPFSNSTPVPGGEEGFSPQLAQTSRLTSQVQESELGIMAKTTVHSNELLQQVLDQLTAINARLDTLDRRLGSLEIENLPRDSEESTPALSKTDGVTKDQLSVLQELGNITGTDLSARHQAELILARIVGSPISRILVKQLSAFLKRKGWACLCCGRPASLVWQAHPSAGKGGYLQFRHRNREEKRVKHNGATRVPNLTLTPMPQTAHSK